MINLNFIYLLGFLFFCFMHPLIGWIPGAGDYFQFLQPVLPAISAISVMFIVLSGYNLRTSIQSSLVGNRLPLSPKIWTLIRTFLFFLFLDSLKKGWVVRSAFFYQWGVLQTVLLSLSLLVFLSTISVRWVWFFGLLFYLSAGLFNYWLGPHWQSVGAEPPLWNEFHLYSISLCLISFGYLSIKTGQSLLQKKHKALLIAILFSISLLVIAQIISNINMSSDDLYMVKNIWLGILVPDPLVYHSYPMTIWFPIIAGGFLIADVMIRVKRPERFINLIGVIGFLGFFGLSFAFYQQSILGVFSVDHFIKSILSYDQWNNLFFYMVGLFCFLLFLVEKLGSSFRALNRLGGVIGGGMIHIFIVVTAVGQYICSLVSKSIALPYSQLVATFALFIIGCGVGYAVEFLLKNKYEFSLKKIRK